MPDAAVKERAVGTFEPGIYFGMPDDEYHAIPALSSSGIKMLRVSTLDFWARSWMNKNREEDMGEESDAKTLGRAYHARILEGKAAFDERFVPDLSPADFPDALHTVAHLKEAIRKWNADSETKLALGGTKEELIGRLLDVQPTAQIWDVICDGYAKKHPGKEFLDASLLHRIELMVAMIERKPDLTNDFRDGMPEVTVCYFCQDTGVPCKMRADYLKPKQITDLKSFANMQERPISDAINRELGNRRMPRQVAWYLDGARYIAPLIKAGRVFGEADKTYLRDLAAGYDKRFKFVFVQKGVAPVARGRWFGTELSSFHIAKAQNDAAKMQFSECLRTFPEGAPWVDLVASDEANDDEVPLYATD